MEAIPDLNALQEKYKSELVILAINDRITFEKLPQFIKENKINYRVVLPLNKEELMTEYYKVSAGKFTGLPYYAVVDKSGKIIERDIHYNEIVKYLGVGRQ